MNHFKPAFRNLILLIIAVVLLGLTVPVFQEPQSSNSVFANGQPVFYPGYGTATIDGVIDEGEWSSADSLTLPMVGGDTALNGTFYVMQTGTVLYFGFSIDDDEYTQDPVGKYGIYGDMLSMDFDDNHNDVLFELGENKLAVFSYDPWLWDAYFLGGGESSDEDISDGGTTDGSGAASRNGDKNQFEIRFPLCSGDTGHDFCVQGGDVIGFRIEYQDAFANPIFDFDNMIYPGTEDFLSLALIEIQTYDPFRQYLPLLLR